MPAKLPFQIDYLSPSQLDKFKLSLKENQQSPLLLIAHKPIDNKDFDIKDSSLIRVNSGLKTISQDNVSCYELWSAPGKWLFNKEMSKTHSEFNYAYNDEFFIAGISVNLSHKRTLQDLSQLVYQEILTLIKKYNKTNILRMWNYFPKINQIDNNLERYQQFCVGRYCAFDNISNYPAASAVGNFSSSLVVTFIASKNKPVFIENPEQISAYEYPEVYSPKSPSFSRACFNSGDKDSQLFISGTASITGHQSRYTNDILGQTRLTLNNLDTLIKHTNSSILKKDKFKLLMSDKKISDKGSPAIKVYVRNPEQQPKIAAILEKYIQKESICYLQADICRQELDIEIELFYP
ncbi:MAG: hypothetical protein HQL46_00285 [Gammaproteobacteria bacterium]|nr:hypothetical protein [Gammaproteobacteria bacterium]